MRRGAPGRRAPTAPGWPRHRGRPDRSLLSRYRVRSPTPASPQSGRTMRVAAGTDGSTTLAPAAGKPPPLACAPATEGAGVGAFDLPAPRPSAACGSPASVELPVAGVAAPAPTVEAVRAREAAPSGAGDRARGAS